MSEIATTKRQRDIIAHTINLESRIRAALGRSQSERRRTDARRADSDNFRNYYCAVVDSETDHEITKLVAMGLMRRDEPLGPHRGNSNYYAYATDAGIREVMP